MSISKFLFPLLAVFASGITQSEYCAPATPAEVCPEGPDRDLKVAVIFDAVSNCYWTRYSLEGISNALGDLSQWVESAGHSMLATYIRSGDGRQQGANCFGPYMVDVPVSSMAANLAGLQNVNYRTGSSPFEPVMVWLVQHHWARENLHSERRIISIATSHLPWVGSGMPELPADFSELCPYWPAGSELNQTSKRPSHEDIKNSLRKHGVALYVWEWEAYWESVPKRIQQWNDYLAEMDITDTKVFGRGWNWCLPQARDYYAADIRELACPSWIATTTTLTPYAPAQVVEDCIMTVGAQLGKEALDDSEVTGARVNECVFGTAEE